MKKSLLFSTMLAVAALLVASPAFAADAFKGKFVANGKSHPLLFAGVFKAGEAQRNDDGDIVDVDALKVVLTEKAPGPGQALDEDTIRSDAYGSYVIATFIAGSLKHAHDTAGGPDMQATINYGGGGFLQAEDVKLEAGVLSGRVHTDGEEDIFGEKLDIDATFSVKVE